jgi:geranylgeranyl pyrophosphate synthase
MFRQCFGHIEQSRDELDAIAAAIHLLQTSTFVIDDIFDGGTLRNNKLTVFGHAGVNYAIIVGEMLQTAATQTIDIEIGRGKFKNKSVVLAMAHEMLTKVYLGQYLDIYNSSNFTITLSDYKRVISLTTGGFLADIARCGALLAGTSKSKTFCLAEYAYK